MFKPFELIINVGVDGRLFHRVNLTLCELCAERTSVGFGSQFWYERSLYFLLQQELEIYLCKPRVVHYLFTAVVTQSFFRILDEESFEEVLQLTVELNKVILILV